MKSTIHPHRSSKMALPAILAFGLFVATLNAAPDAAKSDPALAQQLAGARAKAAQLESLLAQNAPHAMASPEATPMASMAAPSAAATPMAGMGDGKMMMGRIDMMMQKMEKMMPMMEKMMGGMGGSDKMPPSTPMGPSGMGMGRGKMKMAGMMGMKSMGETSPAAIPDSALPGFPGASHIYHIGATGFFLDHPEHISLTNEQQVALNKIKDQAVQAKNASDRALEDAEQELGMLTGADQPDSAKIEAKVQQIGKLSADQRLAFIRAVGEAARLLTAEQRKVLTGFAPPAPSSEMAPAASATPMPMNDM